MKIFVTGGTGFIGRYTVEELKKRGHRVLVLSRKSRGVDVIKGDLSNIATWRGKLKQFKPDAAIHLAWEGIPDFSYARSVKNLDDGLALFGVLAEIGCKKIVGTGTGFECGGRVGKIPHDIPVVTENIFTAAKHALHILGEQLAKEHGMDFVWMRPFNPYGDGQRSGSLIPYIMRCVAEGAPLTLKKPLAQGDFIYVTDAATAFADAVARAKGGAVYNVASGYLTPVRDIAKMICEAMGADKAYIDAFAKTAKGKLSPGPYAEIENARKDIGWRPKVDMKTGIRKTVEKYKNNL